MWFRGGNLALLVVTSHILWCSLICSSDACSVGLHCTLGVGILFWIDLLMVAFVSDGHVVTFSVVVCILLVVLVLFGGAVVSSKVTCFSLFIVIFFSKLLSSSFIFSKNLICALPFTFFFPFRACVQSLSALTIVAAGNKILG
jgi:hypothetical protein